MRKEVYVENASETEISSPEQGYELLCTAMKNRHVASTLANDQSSRSHCIMQLLIERQCTQSLGAGEVIEQIRKSRLNIVDLAGSERQKATQTQGVQLEEASSINRSLANLGLVIQALTKVSMGKNAHVHYRDSKLTYLLRDSLGGNSKTSIIATVSPTDCCLSESLSTLLFAQRAKMIQNKAIINENTSSNIRQLQAEVRRLKKELEQAKRRTSLTSLMLGGTDVNLLHEKPGNSDYSQALSLSPLIPLAAPTPTLLLHTPIQRSSPSSNRRGTIFGFQATMKSVFEPLHIIAGATTKRQETMSGLQEQATAILKISHEWQSLRDRLSILVNKFGEGACLDDSTLTSAIGQRISTVLSEIGANLPGRLLSIHQEISQLFDTIKNDRVSSDPALCSAIDQLQQMKSSLVSYTSRCLSRIESDTNLSVSSETCSSAGATLFTSPRRLPLTSPRAEKKRQEFIQLQLDVERRSNTVVPMSASCSSSTTFASSSSSSKLIERLQWELEELRDLSSQQKSEYTLHLSQMEEESQLLATQLNLLRKQLATVRNTPIKTISPSVGEDLDETESESESEDLEMSNLPSDSTTNNEFEKLLEADSQGIEEDKNLSKQTMRSPSSSRILSPVHKHSKIADELSKQIEKVREDLELALASKSLLESDLQECKEREEISQQRIDELSTQLQDQATQLLKNDELIESQKAILLAEEQLTKSVEEMNLLRQQLSEAEKSEEAAQQELHEACERKREVEKQNESLTSDLTCLKQLLTSFQESNATLLEVIEQKNIEIQSGHQQHHLMQESIDLSASKLSRLQEHISHLENEAERVDTLSAEQMRQLTDRFQQKEVELASRVAELESQLEHENQLHLEAVEDAKLGHSQSQIMEQKLKQHYESELQALRDRLSLAEDGHRAAEEHIVRLQATLDQQISSAAGKDLEIQQLQITAATQASDLETHLTSIISNQKNEISTVRNELQRALHFQTMVGELEQQLSDSEVQKRSLLMSIDEMKVQTCGQKNEIALLSKMVEEGSTRNLQLRDQLSQLQLEHDQLKRVAAESADGLGQTQIKLEVLQALFDDQKAQLRAAIDDNQILEDKTAELTAFSEEMFALRNLSIQKQAETEQQLEVLDGRNKELQNLLVEREETIQLINNQLEDMTRKLEEAEADMAMRMGHQNSKQRIKHMEKLQKENFELKKHVRECDAKLKKFEAQLKGGGSRPALREKDLNQLTTVGTLSPR